MMEREQPLILWVIGALLVFAHLRKAVSSWLYAKLNKGDQNDQCNLMIFMHLMRWRIIPAIAVPFIAAKSLIAHPLPPGYTIRLAEGKDNQLCLDLCRINGEGRFPSDTNEVFALVLQKADHSMLVVESEGKVIACGGVSQTSIHCSLFFGLVHPSYQGRGIGRLLILARLARIHGDGPMTVSIHAVKGSIGYYWRFGFMCYGQWKSEDGGLHPTAGVTVLPADRDSFKVALQQAGYPVLAPV